MATSDIDGGWGVAVMVAAMISRILTFGVGYSVGLFYINFLTEFERSPTATAWAVNSINFCTFLLGDVAILLMRTIGHRWTIAAGGLLSSVGLAATAFVPSLDWAFVTFGLITGVGFCLTFIPVYDMLTVYFHRYQKLVFALSGAATSVGQLVYPPLLNFLFDNFSREGTFLILSAINLNQLGVAAVLMPPRDALGTVTDGDEVETELVKIELNCEVDDTDWQGETACGRWRKSFMLFRDLGFSCCFLSTIMTRVGVGAFYTHVSKFALVLGYDEASASFLVSLIGIATAIGGVGLAVIAQQPRVNAVVLCIAIFTLCGIFIGVFGLIVDYWLLAVCSVVTGLTTAGGALFAVMVIAFTRVQNMAAGISYCSVAIAAGLLLGGPLAARLYEADPSYRLSFAVLGLITAGGSLINVVPMVACRGRSRNGGLRVRN